MTNCFLVLVASLLAGCYSIDIATTSSLKKSALSPEDGRPMEHVVVSNYGWYLFNFIPIACGNDKADAVFPWLFFSNRISATILHDKMMAYAASMNADVRDLAFFCDEKVIFDLPGTHFPLPIPYLLGFRDIQFSGTLIQRKGPQQNNDDKKRKAIDEMNQLLNKLSPENDK